MGPKTKALIDVLDDLASLLESDGNTHWSGWMREARARLLNSDYSGIEYLLSAYGGAGSLNDVVVGLRCENSSFEWKSGAVELNEKFSVLRSSAWKLATAIKVLNNMD